MAFTTIPGASDSDFTTLQGTTGVDTLTVDDNSKVFAELLGGNDLLTMSETVSDFTIKAGTDEDTITLMVMPPMFW